MRTQAVPLRAMAARAALLEQRPPSARSFGVWGGVVFGSAVGGPTIQRRSQSSGGGDGAPAFAETERSRQVPRTTVFMAGEVVQAESHGSGKLALRLQ